MVNNRSIVSIVVTLLVAAALACNGNPTPETPPPPTQDEPSNPISVQDTGSGLSLNNNTTNAYTVRVSFVVPGSEEGVVNVCDPFGPPGNREGFFPEDPIGPYDQPFIPGGSLSVSTSTCGTYTGYSVWVWDLDGNLVFEQHR